MAPMSPADPADPERSGRSGRRDAIYGAVGSGLVLLAVAAIRGSLDAWLVAAGLAAVALSAWAIPALTRRGSSESQAPAGSGGRLGLADAVLAHIPDPVILVDDRAVVVEMNAAAQALLPTLKLREPLSFALRSP